MLIQAIPVRSAIPAEGPFELPFVLEVGSDTVTTVGRPELDLALVLDRSGSMQGRPLDYARQAACAAVSSLRQSDRVAVVIYDHEAHLLSTLRSPCDRTLNLLSQVQARGSTALFAGWAQGAAELQRAGAQERLRRVLLLTDGEANVGPSDPDEVGRQVSALAQSGVQTTTVGFGSGYNETLLRSIAASGGGNHYYVEGPGQLLDVFNEELAGLESTVATEVALYLEGPGRIEPFDALPELPDGGWRLNDLSASWRKQMMFRLVGGEGPRTGAGELRMRLLYTEPATGRRQELVSRLGLPLLAPAEWERQSLDPQVQEHLMLHTADRAQDAAAEELARGDSARAARILREAMGILKDVKGAELQAMSQHLREQAERIEAGSHRAAAKEIAAKRHGGHGMYAVILKRTESKLRQLSELVREGVVSVRVADHRARWLDTTRRPGFAAGRARGLVSGLDRTGLACLEAMVERCWFEPSEVAECLSRQPGQEGLAQRLHTMSWHAAGRDRQDDELLTRVAAIVLPAYSTFGAMEADVALYAAITHRSGPAIAEAVGVAALLFELLSMGERPDPAWWRETFHAHAQEWCAQPVVSDTVRAFLDIMATRPDPQQAREAAAWPALKALVEAAVGALHGPTRLLTGLDATIVEEAVRVFAGN